MAVPQLGRMAYSVTAIVWLLICNIAYSQRVSDNVWSKKQLDKAVEKEGQPPLILRTSSSVLDTQSSASWITTAQSLSHNHFPKNRRSREVTSMESFASSEAATAVEPVSYVSSGSATQARPTNSASADTKPSTSTTSSNQQSTASTTEDDEEAEEETSSSSNGSDNDDDDDDTTNDAEAEAEVDDSNGTTPDVSESSTNNAEDAPYPTPSKAVYTEYPFVVSASKATVAPTYPHWSNPDQKWQHHTSGNGGGATPTKPVVSAPSAAKPVTAPTLASSPAASPTVNDSGTPSVSSPFTGDVPNSASDNGSPVLPSATSPSSSGTSGTTSEGSPVFPSPTFAGASPSASTPTSKSTTTTTGNTPTLSTPVQAPKPFAAAPYNDYGLHYARANKIQDKCGVTMKERTQQLLAALATYSDAEALQNPFAPQYQALRWLDDADDAVLCADDPRLAQRYTLAVVYFGLNGQEWKNCQAALADDADLGDCDTQNGTVTRWLAKGSECLWFGVACDESGRVAKLSLKDNNLAGSLPTELFTSLPWLSGLSLDHNKNITGTIPTTMDFVNLTYIELDDNALTGPFPEVFYSMTTLKAIDLNGNQLTGILSNDIGNLADLMVLQLENNQFTGPLPTKGLAQLSSMLLLTLHGNDFSGSMDQVCDNVPMIRQTSPEYLQFFSTDCAQTIECSCCSACF